jgi:hypothetical protein
MINISISQLILLVIILFIFFGDVNVIKSKVINLLTELKKWKNNQEK